MSVFFVGFVMGIAAVIFISFAMVESRQWLIDDCIKYQRISTNGKQYACALIEITAHDKIDP